VWLQADLAAGGVRANRLTMPNRAKQIKAIKTAKIISPSKRLAKGPAKGPPLKRTQDLVRATKPFNDGGKKIAQIFLS
jgi:hypothetical protein